ncbi:cytochrome P450 PksS [Archangium gephyra]|uniref:Cytochrome P450 PksS n=2 Tax=Archangium gephyra TaxID=48 RepID=A0AAC8TF45_9BACT|nr:putative cytochrome P450 hydroxylase [Archangium gephyra]REG22563.1 cytochrome P450 PksS [Archangium gephyra]
MTGSTVTDRNLFSPENLRNPIPLYKDLRENDPVHFVEPMQAWFITRHDDVMEGFRDPRLSASRGQLFEYQLQGVDPNVAREFLGTIQHQMFMKDGSEHVRLRRQTLTGFSNQKLDDMRPTVHRIMRELLDEVYPQGHMDLLKDIAFPMPALALAELINVPLADRARFKRWSEYLADFSAPAVGANPVELATNANQAMVEMKQLLLPVIEERRRNPGTDSLSLMIQAEAEGRMTPEELVANICLIMFAGHTTTTDQLCNGLYDLLTHPDQLQKLRADMGLMKSAVEEMLRYTSAVPSITRVAGEDFEWHGKQLRKGQLVFLMMASANRDPSAFPEPDRFDITRDSTQQKHASFGFGAHHCMGAGLSRRELEIGLTLLLERLPGLRLDETRQPRLKCHSLTFRGFDSLPLRW